MLTQTIVQIRPDHLPFMVRNLQNLPLQPLPDNLIITEGFLRALYQDLLGRGIDPVGLQNWQALMAGGMSRATVVTSIAASGESLRHEVDQAYAQTLHRSADPGGETGWADYLGAGHDNDDLLAALASSQEYFLSAQAQPR